MTAIDQAFGETKVYMQFAMQFAMYRVLHFSDNSSIVFHHLVHGFIKEKTPQLEKKALRVLKRDYPGNETVKKVVSYFVRFLDTATLTFLFSKYVLRSLTASFRKEFAFTVLSTGGSYLLSELFNAMQWLQLEMREQNIARRLDGMQREVIRKSMLETFPDKIGLLSQLALVQAQKTSISSIFMNEETKYQDIHQTIKDVCAEYRAVVHELVMSERDVIRILTHEWFPDALRQAVLVIPKEGQSLPEHTVWERDENITVPKIRIKDLQLFIEENLARPFLTSP